MEHVTPLPSHGAVFFDDRDRGRTLRLSFHAEAAVFVISLWRYDTCQSTFRLSVDDAPEFVHQLVESLTGQLNPPQQHNSEATA
jgi:hypothetical protein